MIRLVTAWPEAAQAVPYLRPRYNKCLAPNHVLMLNPLWCRLRRNKIELPKQLSAGGWTSSVGDHHVV